jgi:hypothetical protein
MKYPLTLAIFLLLTACAGTEKKLYSLPDGLDTVVAKAPLACQFTKQIAANKSSNWYFWRSPLRTETHDGLSNQGEIWERNNAGQLFYTRLFYNEKIALEFLPGDLSAIDTTPSWEQLGSLVDPKSLGKQLTLVSKETDGKLAIEHYKGNINGVLTEVDWSPALQLPVHLNKALPDGNLTLTIAKCGNNAKLNISPISKTELDDFRHLDYTDLGDMEDDPMVKHIEQLMGGHHHEH